MQNTRNTYCDQSNYSSRIVFSHIECRHTGNSAIRSENPTVEPNMKWIGRPIAEIWPFEIFPNERSVGRRSSIYRPTSYTDLIRSARGVKNKVSQTTETDRQMQDKFKPMKLMTNY